MVNCDYCNKPIDGYPHKCKYCGQLHCSEHLLPESHECLGLDHYKQRKENIWKKEMTSFISGNYVNPKRNEEKPTIEFGRPLRHKPKEEKKQTFSERIKDYGLDRYEELKYWLNKRERQRYDFPTKSNYLIKTMLIFIASVVGVAIFYSNAQKLNQISLWIVKLGGVLILTSLFFAIKFGLRVGKETLNMFSRQRNWFRYLVIIIIILLLWQGYTHRYTVLNPAFEIYNKTNLTLLMPIGFNNFTLDLQYKDKSSNYGYDNYKPSNAQSDKKSEDTVTWKIKAGSPFQPTIDIGSLETEIHNLINEEREKNGARALSFDSQLSEVARGHSQDMAQNNFFEHVNLQGQDPTERANRKGYRCYKNYGGYYTDGIAENIFQNNLYDSITYINLIPIHDWNTQGEIPQSTVQGWMDSAGHRQNILTRTYDREGIGIAISGDDKVYITEDFC